VGLSRGAIIMTRCRLYKAGPVRIEMDTLKDGKFNRIDAWSNGAYFYIDKQENNLLELEAVELNGAMPLRSPAT